MTIVKHFDTTVVKNKYSKKYIIFVSISLFLLMLVEIWASNSVVTYGEKLKNLSTLADTLNLENQILENEIAKKAALTNIASKSAELGFSKPESVQYIR